MKTFSELMDIWNSDEGRPYKGNLIDMDAYESAPDSIGCMCAQGQVLHLLAGWGPEILNSTAQVEADAKVAATLNISLAHSILLWNVNDKFDGAPAVVLTDPGAVIGNKWSEILDFWFYLDGMTTDQWSAAGDAARAAAGDAAWAAAGAAARAAAGDAARAAAGAAAWAAAGAAAWATAGAAAGATSEIQGIDLLRQRKTPLFFLPAFGFEGPEDIPARPDNYGPFA